MKISKEKFGTSSNWKWFNDPRQFFISLARYKGMQINKISVFVSFDFIK